MSVLDGWWAEAYDGLNGFAIGRGETHSSADVHDDRDAAALAAVLHRRSRADSTTTATATACRASGSRGSSARIRTLGWRFSADRMVKDYVTSAYIPAAGGTSCAVF